MAPSILSKLYKNVTLETTIAECRGRSTDGDLGIELEIEGLLHEPKPNSYWGVKAEGSLRQNPHGWEFVLLNPVPWDPNIDKVLAVLGDSLSRSKLSPSLRCSTHIHVNISKRKVREVYNILMYYYLVESLLVQTQGHMRIGNLFCLRLEDAEEGIRALIDAYTSGHFGYFDMNSFKYGAVNLAAPMKFGSLEFRFLRPLTDMKLMKMWCDILYTLVNNSCKIPIKTSIQAVQSDPVDFLSLVFEDHHIKFLKEAAGITNSFDLRGILQTNLDLVEQFYRETTKKKKFRLPKDFVQSLGDIEYDPHRPWKTLTIDDFATAESTNILDEIQEIQVSNNPVWAED